ncbi:unnamed protein product [Mucor fragilis]
MLGKPLYLDLASPTTETYYAFLAKDPARGQLVRLINYSPINGNKKGRELMKKNVKMVFTPNIENLHTLTTVWFSKDPGHSYLISRLDQFTKLTNFTYAGNINDLSHLEYILRKCPHLKLLTLRIHQYSMGEMRSVLFKDEILDWAKATIK